MCGRFVSASAPETIAAYFDAIVRTEPLPPDHNVAPTSDVYGVVVEPADPGARALRAFHWGLVPGWAKDRSIGQRMINARSETLAEKPSFKGPFRTRRLIVPMDGFYEWKPGRPDGPRTASGRPAKQPVYVRRRDGEPLAVAGLWSRWVDPAHRDEADPPVLHSATVITTAANATMEPIHDRMPVILPRSAWAPWLDPDTDDVDALSRLLVPAPDDLLVTYEVSTRVNAVREHGPELIEPIDPEAPPVDRLY